eukprot:g3669.t1
MSAAGGDRPNGHLPWDGDKKFGCIDVRYSDKAPCLTINSDLSGFAYYASGRVAACMSCIKGYQYKAFFYANDKKKTLIGCLDEKGLGFAYSFAADGERAKKGSQFLGEKLVLTRKGASYTPGGDTGEKITKAWKWNPNAQGAGTPPTEPIEIDMNESLHFKFIDRDNIFVTFRAPEEGLVYTFDCSRKFRRTDTYLDHGQRSTLFKGKIDLTVKTPSLIERFDEQERASRLTKANVGSADVRDPEIRAAMEAQERITAKYKEKIEKNQWADTFVGGEWRVDSLAKTVAEVPRLQPQDTETGPMPESAAAGIYARGPGPGHKADKGGTLSLAATAPAAVVAAEFQPGFSQSVFEKANLLATNNLTQMMAAASGADSTVGNGSDPRKISEENEFETRMRLQRENPKLPRPFVLRAASGRYTRDMPVEQDMEDVLGLDEVTPSNFDDLVRGSDSPSQLYVVLCYRADEQAHVWAEQLMQYVLGSVSVASAQASNNNNPRQRPNREQFPYRIGRFDMAQGAYLLRRYNVKSLPCYLAFYGGRLVKAQAMGGKAVKLTRAGDAPRALLYEPDFASQIKTEKIMKRLNWKWDLCMTSRAAMARSKTLADSGKHLGPERQDEYIHRAIFVNAEMVDSKELRTVKQFLVRQAGGGDIGQKKLIFVSMLKMGAVRLAGLPLTQPPADGKPMACPRTGVVWCATEEHLIGNLCNVAVVKDIRRGTLTEISRRCQEAAQLVKDAQVNAKGGKASSEGVPRQEVDGRHMGHTKSDLLREFAEARSMGERGQFLPPGYKFGLQLTTKGSNFRGQDLGVKISKKERDAASRRGL